MNDTRILIHDTSEIYTKLINVNFSNHGNFYYTNSMYNFDNINFKKFTLIMIFINSHEDLIDLAYLFKVQNVRFVVGSFTRSIFFKLKYFNDIDLINLNTPKKELIEEIKNHINYHLLINS